MVRLFIKVIISYIQFVFGKVRHCSAVIFLYLLQIRTFGEKQVETLVFLYQGTVRLHVTVIITRLEKNSVMVPFIIESNQPVKDLGCEVTALI